MAGSPKKRARREAARKASAKPGRKRMLTPAVMRKTYQLARVGLTNEQIAASIGVSSRSFFKWKERGRKGEAPYEGWLIHLEAAEVGYESKWLSIAERAAEKGAEAVNDYRGPLAILEYRERRRSGGVKRVELTGKDGGPLEVEDSAARRESIMGKLAGLAAGADAGAVPEGTDG